MNGDSLRTHARLERLCSPAIWAEGPVWLPQEDAVVFSDVKGNRMFRWSRRGELSLYRSPSHYANGNARDGEGAWSAANTGGAALAAPKAMARYAC